jgi:hypothetical protein
MNLLQNWESRLAEKDIAWIIRRNTMVSPARIQNLSRLAQRIEDEHDWYDSGKLCFETFYNVVVCRVFISIDDYGDWLGCRRAVDEFFQRRALSHQLQPVNHTALWFQIL